MYTTLHGVLVSNVDLTMDVWSEVAHHAAYFVQFESKHDVLWLTKSIIQQGGVAFRVPPSSNP